MDATDVTSQPPEAPGVATLVEHAVTLLRAAVVSGEIAPRARIRIEETARWLGMSAIPVREALRTLATEGLVVPLPRRGYRAADMTADDVADTYRLRLLLDPMAVQLAVPQLGPEQLAELDHRYQALAGAHRSGEAARLRQSHRSFHWGIYDHCGSRWVLRCLEILWENSARYQQAAAARAAAAGWPDEHRAILDACRAKDADAAAEAMRRHLTRARDDLRALLVNR